ncbi:MAG: carboxypeptidase regulatory-like domain-containing protein [Chloroflexi bacterium]|nr:carboxypeptidase regulatory-like domain-containing protein [Chloroflexota bacterium]
MTDQVTGLPLPGATVELRDASGSLVATATTGGDGGYDFGTRPAGSYALAFSAPNYSSATAGAVVVAGQATRVDQALVPLAGAIHGTVTNLFTGQPVAGATVTLSQGGAATATTAADASGHYAFSPVAPGVDSLVAASHPDYLVVPSSSASFRLPAGGSATLDLQLKPKLGAIAGTVIDALTRLPIPGATVQIVSPGGLAFATLATGTDGTYSVQEVPPGGPYLLRFSAEGYTPASGSTAVVAGQTAIVDAELMRRQGAITGLVLDRDTRLPIPLAVVRLLDAQGGVEMAPSILSDASGGFAFAAPSAGTYVVHASSPTSGPAAGGYVEIPESSQSVRATLEGEVGGTLLLAPGPAALVGTVLNSVDDQPIPGASVVVARAEGPTIASLSAADDGSFGVSEVTPGTYRVNASREGFWPAGGSVQVPPGQTGTIVLRLTPQDLGGLSGTVTDPAGTPIPDTTITVTSTGQPEITTTTDGGGHYVVPGLSPGQYTVAANHPDYYPADPASVQLVRIAVQDFILRPRPSTFRIETVDERTGRTVMDVDLTVTFAPTEGVIAQRKSDTSGVATVGGLEPGTYVVTGQKPGYASKSERVKVGPNRFVVVRLRLSLALTGVVASRETGEAIPFARVNVYRLSAPTGPGTGHGRRSGGASLPQPSPTGEAPLLGGVLPGAGQAAQPEASESGFVALGMLRPLANSAALQVQRTGVLVATGVADERGHFWFDLADDGDFFVLAESPGWTQIQESDDSGNVTIEGPLMVVELLLTRDAEAEVTPDAAPLPRALPNTGDGSRVTILPRALPNTGDGSQAAMLATEGPVQAGLLATEASAQTSLAGDARRPPALIDIPSLGVFASIVPVGLEADGAMGAPSDPDTVGWYELGPTLAGPGNVILAGHVDWGGRLRVFGWLRQLQPGDVVRVGDSDGNWYDYRVTWSWLVDAEDAPLEEVFGQGPLSELTLITCGGVFDPATHRYLSRLVVRAVRE